jgi:hypothetical protein
MTPCKKWKATHSSVQSLVFGNGTNGKLWRFTHLGLNRETRPRLGPSVASSLRHSPSVEHVTAASSPCHAPSRRRQPFGSSSTIRALQVCVSGVSIVCATYVLLYDPSKKGGIAPRPIATASTNDADGADGIFGTRAHPYHSGPAPALTRERDLNTHRPEEMSAPVAGDWRAPADFLPIRRPSRSHCGHSPHTNSGDLTRCRSTWSG